MKKLVSILIPLVIMTMFMASCTADGPDGTGPGSKNPEGEPIEFVISIDSPTRVATDSDYKSHWEAGDEIGVFASESPVIASSDNPIHNMKLTFDGTKWVGPIYWPDTQKKYLFLAYYPYDDNNGDPAGLDPDRIDFSVREDQSGSPGPTGGYSSSCLMSSPISAVRYDSHTPVTLYFYHMNSLVELDITEREINIPFYQSEHLKVTLKGVRTSGVYSLNVMDGATKGETIADVTMMRVQQPGDEDYYTKYTYRALIPVQSVGDGDRLFLIEQDADGDPQTLGPEDFSFNYFADGNTSFSKGSVHRYRMKLTECDPDHKYAVGDPYPHAGPAKGMVYILDTSHPSYDPVEMKGQSGKVIALDSIVTQYSLRTDILLGADSRTDGLYNVRKIFENDGWETFVPFAVRIASMNPPGTVYSSGAKGIWYIGSIEELIELRNVWNGGANGYNVGGMRDRFNGWLSDLGGNPMIVLNTPMSSTEVSEDKYKLVTLHSGTEMDETKIYRYTARPMLVF